MTENHTYRTSTLDGGRFGVLASQEGAVHGSIKKGISMTVTKRPRKIKRVVGDVVQIPLGDERWGYGVVLDRSLIAFWDLERRSAVVPPLDELVNAAVVFRLWVAHYAVERGRWPVVGHIEPSQTLRDPPSFAKIDPISKAISITMTGAEEIAATPDVLDRLEIAAVWDAEHVEGRLRDHFAGRPNAWVEILRRR